MKDNNVILEVKDLHKSFGEQEVLKGISTEVNRGDVIAIIGPSGCGKSTFLRSLNLLETPTSGQILFEGTDLTDKSTDINVTRQKIGMVFQQFNLFPNMTILENIMLAPVKLNKMTKEEAEKKAMELLKPGEICSETYLVAGAFDSKEEATNYMDYLKTQFVRFLILQIAMTQQLSKASFAFVPCQDFTRKWTDKQLFEKYGLSSEEVNYIQGMIKEMA